jgi:glycosyltransferase involved in cell wall biosynthesis
VSAGKIVVILSGFPRHSETFALHELIALEQRGALAAIFATKPGDGTALQPATQSLAGRVQILPEGTPQEQAAVVVQKLAGQPVSGIHGYFAHAPADVAARVASQLGVPYGFSVHAKDARKVDPLVLARRSQHAACVVACNTDVAQEIRKWGAEVHLVPHGVDLERFRPHPFPAAVPLRLLAVGRLVEKKGFDVLLAAAARLRFSFRLRIVGEGPEAGRLRSMIAGSGLADRVTLCGAQTHEELPQEYRNAHLLVAPSILDHSGDRDGLPNVILEAMASGRPVVASAVGAIGSAVVHGETGRLVAPNDPIALAHTLEIFARWPALLHELGRRGRERVERDYEVGRCTDRLYHLLRTAYA